jgi:hypothetical protein
MRQFMLTAAVLFLGTLTGCGSCSSCGGGADGSGGRLSHAHGVCDCDSEDHCSSRSPWIRTNAGLAAPVAEPIAPPAKLPDGKKDL